MSISKEKLEGLYLKAPHAFWIWTGTKKLIVKPELFKEKLDKQFYIIENKDGKDITYGIIKLKKVERIDLAQLSQLKDLHKISDEKRDEWWGRESKLYSYSFDIIEKFKEPVEVSMSKTGETFVSDVTLQTGPTGSSDVAGTPLSGHGLQPIAYDGKKKKNKKLKEEELEEVEKELFVRKRGSRWCVVHGSPQTGGPRDKPPGSVIKCFPTKAEADRMHRAIMASKARRGKLIEDITNLELLSYFDDSKIIKDFISILKLENMGSSTGVCLPIEIKPLEPYIPQKPKGSTFYEIDKAIEAIL